MRVVIGVFAVLLVLSIGTFFGFQYWKSQTKEASPPKQVSYESGNFELKVNYSQPSKNGRKIFGNVVPYGEVWRTGANEPTTITFNKKIIFSEDTVKAGTYSLWTIPQESQWTVILNKEIPFWGIGLGGEPSRDPDQDVAIVNVPSRTLEKVEEKFIIELVYNVNLSMSWDKTKVMVPIEFSAY